MKLMVIGAHPDDAEFHAGGLMHKWISAGQQLMIMCLTDGSAGHHTHDAATLASLRRQEAQAAADQLQARLQVWDEADGSLQPTLELRHKLIGSIRQFAPDLIVTHRPADYHPDHRATAQLVQDACYLLQVPNVVPDIAPLRQVPPVLLAWDRFTYPRPFRANCLIDTSAHIDAIVSLLQCHASQVYEWLPYTQNIEVPAQDSARELWLKNWYSRRPAYVARAFAGSSMKFAEAYEVSEYGGPFSVADFAVGRDFFVAVEH